LESSLRVTPNRAAFEQSAVAEEAINNSSQWKMSTEPLLENP